MTPDPRVAAVETALKRYTSPGHTNGWGAVQGFGMSVAEILTVADAVDPVRGELRLHQQQRAAVLALHQPHDVRHFANPGGDMRVPWYPGPDDPYEIRQHCGTCECGQDDWPCATVIALGGTND